MDKEITDVVSEWESVPIGTGYAGLQSLADQDFSGAVTAGLTWAFFLNGRIVGVFEGDIGDFDGADLSVYAAPDPSLPLLFAMQETGGETRAQYYTNDTPLREVDRTLSSGNFSGYVELSDNVLSGDYYVVYHGGRSMSVAFVGASRRLVTDEEAFDLAADEVGIYDVNAVDIDVVEIPGDHGGAAVGSEDEDTADDWDEADADGVAAVGGFESDDDADEGGVESGGEIETEQDGIRAEDEFGVDDAAHSDTDADGVGALDAYGPTDEFGADDVTFGERDDSLDAGTDTAAGTEDETSEDETDEVNPDEDETSEIDADEPDPDELSDVQLADEADEGEGADENPETGDADDADPETADDTPTEMAEMGQEVEADTSVSEAETEETETTEGIGSEVTNGSEHDDEDEDEDTRVDAGPAHEDDTPDEWTVTAETGTDDGDDVFSAEQQWREARQIPALSPDDTMESDDDASSGRGGAVVTEQPGRQPRRGESAAQPSTRGQRANDGQTGEAVSGLEEQVRTLEASLQSTAVERDELAAQVEELEGQAEELEERLETITRERDKYRVRVADLESELERLREVTEASDVSLNSERLSPADAREQTNLFIRYRSKGKPTLEKARAGNVKQSEVVDNLRVEYHTTFDADSVTVDGKPYEEFLYSTTEWGFVKWVTEELLYEIGRSGNRSELAGIFDRIPEIDRVQFDGEVPVTITEDGRESHESRSFDLVFRDTMGDPLFVADVDTSRNATSASAVNTLIQGARAVGTSKDTLGGAFSVTTSFFDSAALDAVGEATGSGLLSRSSKKSFVKVSRKQGYHLCLVEARSDEYHLSVPEL